VKSPPKRNSYSLDNICFESAATNSRREPNDLAVAEGEVCNHPQITGAASFRIGGAWLAFSYGYWSLARLTSVTESSENTSHNPLFETICSLWRRCERCQQFVAHIRRPTRTLDE
jgi:hypothetical protein